MAKTLYICYFGLREPLVQTQVIPYLLEIAKDDIKVSLLTFEPESDSQWEEEKRLELAGQGIDWHWLRYHKRPSAIATAYDIFRGVLFISRFLAREKVDLLHGRVHVPTLMGAIARKFSRRKPKLLFDIRGFFPEEYTDAGVWPEGGWLYRAAKRVEKWLLKEADGYVVLTEKARGLLFPESKTSGVDTFGRPVEVIPCCVDLERFFAANAESRAAMRAELRVEDRRVISYVGSFGGWYMTEEMLDFFTAARERDPSVFILILTQRNRELVENNLRLRGFNRYDFLVESVSPEDLPRYICAADLAISFIKACYSKQSSSPTKIAEYLAAGLPIIANRGVGDLDKLIESNGVGYLLEDFSSESYLNALNAIETLGDVRERCRETAAREFDLKKTGGNRYRLLYDKVLRRRKN